jgi:predicted ATPase/class 3 adenylate cyclase/tetratricopeptide (TPR) repeat protein
MNFPSGTVTFLFTDIEGSTRLAQSHHAQWETLRNRHHAIMNQAMQANNGHIFQIVGDEFCVAFHTAADAVRAAAEAQRKLYAEAWEPAPLKVRMGIHSGTALAGEVVDRSGGYTGYTALARASRLMSAGYGGQVLISLATEVLVRDELPEDVSLRDLGEQRLKDLIRPEHIYQLVIPNLPSDFPPIRTLESYRHNLPMQMTTFIGREKEMIEIKQAIHDHRLVTLTGAGGTGKTRLALQVAADLLDQFSDGVWFVELALIVDPELIPQTILTATEVQIQQGRSALDSLIDFLGEKTSLVVLDNCEHLIEACTKLADTLLHSAPNLKILASSREALGVKGEQAWHVPSLSTPDLKHLPATEQLSQYEAVRLFIDRAVLVQPHFEINNENAPAIAQICYRLDGIPLALELAAARVRVLKVEQIAERLNDRFRLLTGGSRTALPRQQTLRATIDWSYDLLSESERLLIKRLAVFMGGCTLEIVEQVCSDDRINADDILDIISHLVDKSLISVDEQTKHTRYRMLEMVRQYAQEKLFESGEGEKARDRHLQAFFELAEEAEAELTGARQIEWLDRLEVELGNLRAALEWTIESNIEAGLRMGAALWRFWLVRGYETEGQEWLEQLLVAADHAQDPSPLWRPKALYVASDLSLKQSDYTRALALAEESLALCRKMEDRQQLAFSLAIAGRAASLMDDQARVGILCKESLELFRTARNERGAALALSYLSYLAYAQDDLEQAKTILEECLGLQKKMADKWGITETINMLGQIARTRGDYERAIEMHEEGLELARELGSKPGIVYALNLLAWALREQGDFKRASLLYEECLAKARELGYKLRIMGALNGLGVIAWRQGDFERARTLLEEGMVMRKEIGNKSWIVYGQNNLGDALRAEGDTAQAAVLYKEALTITLTNIHYSNWDMLDCLRRIAVVTADQKRAAILFGAVDVLLKNGKIPLSPLDRADYDRDIAAVRAQLDEATFSKAWNKGSSMTLEQAVAFAQERL